MSGSQLRDAIKERWGFCEVLPLGVQAALAKEFGVTRARAQQIVAELGKRGAKSKARRACASCGAELSLKSTAMLCMDCRWIDIACGWCGKPVRRLASALLARMRAPDRGFGTYTGAVFCDRSCMGHAMSVKGVEARRNKPMRHGTSHARYRRGCDCDECREGARRVSRAAYLRRKAKAS